MTRKLLSIFVALMMVLGIVAAPASALTKFDPAEELPECAAAILFTNDVHCGIEDGWGYAGVAAAKKYFESNGVDTLLVDAGDHVQGGPIGTLSRGQYIIDIMNYVGYDLAIPGNHEFDYTMEQFFDLVDSANYPYISANFMNYENGSATSPVFDAYKLYELGGYKVAFVGLSTPETLVKSTPTYFMNDAGEYIYGFCQDETGEGVYAACQNAVDAAKAAGADYVIVVGHMGIDEQSEPWRSTDVIHNINGVDIFIDGHSHSVVDETVEDKDGNPVRLLQTGTKLANLGRIFITEDGSIQAGVFPAEDIDEVGPDPDTQAFIDGIKAQYEDLLNTQVAYTPFDLTVNDPETGARIVRKMETNLGDLCADAYRTLFDADIAFVNGGGVRANIPTGPITYGQILNVHPFGNSACLVEVTGQQILDALEMGSRNCPAENGGFLQCAGIKYEIHTQIPANVEIDTDGMWIGNAGSEYRVKNVQVMNRETGNYEPLDLAKTYTLASHNYMLKNCGDGFGMFGTANVTLLADEVMLDNAVLINYIQSMPANADYDHVVAEDYSDPYGQGRITIVTEEPAAETAYILFSNDVHCGIEDNWGYAGLAAMKKFLLADGADVMLVDAGDHVQGGPIGTLSRGQYIIDIMNYVGYDLAIPGNHEFDYTMDRFFELVDSANYPYISANFMNYENGSATSPVFDAYKIYELAGHKVAFVGLSTPETLVKSTPTYFMNDAGEYIYGFCQDETGVGVYTACQNAIDAARAEGAEYVIVVGHMGIDEQSEPWRSTDVIANISGADIFIDGHSHSEVDTFVDDKDGNHVQLLQTGTKFANIGSIRIDPAGITAWLIPYSEDALAQVGGPDPDTQAFIDNIKAQYEDLLNTVVAYTEFDLTVNDPETGARIVRKMETNLGDLCADAYRELFGADIAFVNGGGVRANIPEGPITYGQILNVHPFGNSACLVEVTGQQILDALEMGSRNCPAENGGFLQCSGITYEIHTQIPANVVLGTDGMWESAGDGEYRVQNVQVMNRETGEYEPLDLAKTYTLASHNYMLKNCGDGFGMFGTANVTLLADEVMLDNAVLINHIQSMPAKTIDGVEYEHVVTSEYADPYGQGRIVIVEEEPAPVLGDADGDGDVDANDALLVMRYAMGLIELTDEQLATLDVNGDGEVNMQDALLIMRKSMGIIDEFPVEAKPVE